MGLREAETKRVHLANSALSVAALSLMGVWTNLAGYGGIFLDPSSTSNALEAMRYAYYAGAVLAAGLLALQSRRILKTERGLRLCIPVIMGFGTLCYALAYNQTLFDPLLLGSSTSFLLGCCYLWIVATLYISLMRELSVAKAICAILAAQVTEQLLSVIVSQLVPPTAQMILCFMCPLFVLVALFGISSQTQNALPHKAFSRSAQSHTFLLQAASGVAIVAMGAASSVGQWGLARPAFTTEDGMTAFIHTAISCLLLIGLVAAFLLPEIGHPISYRYQMPFLVIAASIMLATLQPSLDQEWLGAFDIVQNAVEFFSHVLLWVILAEAVKETGKNPYFLAGMSLIPYSVLSLCWVVLLESTAQASTFVFIFISYVLILIVAVHPRLLYERELPHLTLSQQMNEYTLDGEPEIPYESNGALVVETVQRRCAYVGKHYNLSSREIDVLSLLAQGRSRPAIQKLLVLSEGTVKTHLSHIYEKLHVSSAQEALDIIYGTTAIDSPFDPPLNDSVR